MIKLNWLGQVEYEHALSQQRERRDQIVAGQAKECFWLLEHPPVLTVGRRAVHDLPRPEELSELQLEVVVTERGGLATYHGPGQLVGYLLVDIASRGIKVREMVCAIENGVIRWLEENGVAASRRLGFPGVWVGKSKICALGLHFRKGVSMHGFALNLTTDLSGYSPITPCGITDGGITSFLKETGRSQTPQDVAFSVAGRIIEALRLTPYVYADNDVALEGM
jgi:lipoate-protein ligase B